MTMTDPIADMLTRIRNANVALHDKVRMPSSKQKEALARILQQEGYFQGFERLLGHFYAALAGDGPPPIGIDEMDATNRLVEDMLATENQL